jgi:hypothetical protein
VANERGVVELGIGRGCVGVEDGLFLGFLGVGRDRGGG